VSEREIEMICESFSINLIGRKRKVKTGCERGFWRRIMRSIPDGGGNFVYLYDGNL
jgi:hypothetical protein